MELLVHLSRALRNRPGVLSKDSAHVVLLGWEAKNSLHIRSPVMASASQATNEPRQLSSFTKHQFGQAGLAGTKKGWYREMMSSATALQHLKYTNHYSRVATIAGALSTIRALEQQEFCATQSRDPPDFHWFLHISIVFLRGCHF